MPTMQAVITTKMFDSQGMSHFKVYKMHKRLSPVTTIIKNMVLVDGLCI